MIDLAMKQNINFVFEAVLMINIYCFKMFDLLLFY